MNVTTDDVYILHSRPYRETSQLTDLLTENFGKLRVVHRGGKQKKLQPFTRATATWSGKGELKSLRTIEPVGIPKQLLGVKLFSALYINELLSKVLHDHDPHPQLFLEYQNLLDHLSQGEVIADIPLRFYERLILDELGYGYDFAHDAATGQPIDAELWYWFEHERGFIALDRPRHQENNPRWVLGEHLQALENADYQSAQVRQVAKTLHQLAINQLLGGKVLNSGTYFKKSRGVK